MSGVLLDTNVVSELVRPAPDARVVAFVRSQSDAWLSTVTLHELVYGAERVTDPNRRTRLLSWIDGIRAQFRHRLVPVDGGVAELAGRMRADAERQGRPADPMDVLTAACARQCGLTLATRNVRDFEALGVRLTDPWASP